MPTSVFRLVTVGLLFIIAGRLAAIQDATDPDIFILVAGLCQTVLGSALVIFGLLDWIFERRSKQINES